MEAGGVIQKHTKYVRQKAATAIKSTLTRCSAHREDATILNLRHFTNMVTK